MTGTTSLRSELEALLARQRSAFEQDLPVSAAVRRDRIARAIDLLLRHRDRLCEAMSEDFGNRPRPMSLVTDIVAPIQALRGTSRELGKWMRAQKRRLPFPLGAVGCSGVVEYQPKGVVGIVAPWNYPVHLVFIPLAGVLGAGNRAMIKTSEFAPTTAALIRELIGSAFGADEIAVVNGDALVAQAFCALPFDHLLFTGSPAVGRHVMRAAADNLVPVTLELGGKSPVIISRSADLSHAAPLIGQNKIINAGQTCIAPDYLFVPREHADALVNAIATEIGRMYPRIGGNPDYTSVINDRHAERLQAIVAEAAARGARVTVVNPAGEELGPLIAERRLPLSIVRGADDSMRILQEELFGPVLPVLEYDSIEEAIRYVNAHPRPLALYYFGRDAAEERRVLDRTHSGGVTVNDLTWHAGFDDLPLGGIGPSGLGSYHGERGFHEFSHARSVFRQSRIDLSGLSGMRPPYGARMTRTIERGLKG